MPRRFDASKFGLDHLKKTAEKCKNWGRWGADDEIGTLNFITPESIAGAARLIRRGKEAAHTNDPEVLTGKLPDIVAHVANTLAAYGEKLSAGDVIITGSITPPIMLEPDDEELTHALDPIGEVSVSFSRE